MEKLKYMILVLILLLIALICILLMINTNETNTLIEREIPEESKEELKIEDNMPTFLLANEMIDNFFKYIKEEDTKVQNNVAAFGILDKNYANKNQITKENILTKLSVYKNIESYSSESMHVEEYLQGEEYANIFLYIKGKARSGGNTYNIYIILKQDFTNSTYSIEFINEQEYTSILNKGKGYIAKTTIEETEYNKMYTKTVTDYDACLAHMSDYTNILKSHLEEAYNILDEEYRNKRFGNLEEFKNYINENPELTINTGFIEYKVNNYNSKTEYICKDNYGKLYIFTEEYPMQYSLKLDTYTIETTEQIEKYNDYNEEQRVKVNIQKFILMINNQDYKNAYSKLDTNFRETYYKNQDDFKTFIKANMFKYNEITLEKIEKIQNNYILQFKLTDMTEGKYNDETKRNIENYRYKVVMKLLEGREFVMSFSLQ